MIQWIHISDLQFGTNSASDETARLLVEEVARQQPAFVIHSGDHVHGALNDTAEEKARVKEYWAGYQQAVKPLKKVCPLLCVPGNHDPTGNALSLKTYLRQTGRAGQPPYYATTIEGIHIISLDVVPLRHKGGFVKGSAQGKWLRSHLRRPRRTGALVVVGHYPIFMSPWILHNVDPSLGYDEQTREQGVLLPLLLQARADLYLCGHQHVYERSRYQNLTQVMAGGDGIAFEGHLDHQTGKYCRVQDERRGYIRFTLTDKTLRGEAVSVDGEIMDTWWQKRNHC
jgi:3',5'-cyclic AMP phosphodiesterase CpdA